MAPIRIFIAIHIPDNIKTEISRLQNSLQSYGERIGWTRPDNIHLTLKFIGDSQPQQVDAIAAALNEIAKDMQPFSFETSMPGAFPNLRRPRVLWVGVHDRLNCIGQLADLMDETLARHGVERNAFPFKPHLTIGRIREQPQKAFLQAYAIADFPNLNAQVQDFLLMQNDLRKTEKVYTVLHKTSLSPD